MRIIRGWAMYRMRILPGRAAVSLVRIASVVAGHVMRRRGLRGGERSVIRGGRSCRRLRGSRRRMRGAVVHRMVRVRVLDG